VRLRGLAFKERIKAMLELAAPAHREALAREAHDMSRRADRSSVSQGH